ncbi:cytochrome P450 [Apiospora saccharicola]|uniref:Cytochrome P450 n=1 Tax=Apiospora saccharicola TaxID=335842 RepID=A0ABR1TK10_9PEZI
MFHPVSTGTPRVTPKDGIEIGGRYFSAGLTLSLNTHSMNSSEAVWAPDEAVQAATIVRDYDIRQVDPKQKWTCSVYSTVVPQDWPVYIGKRRRKGGIPRGSVSLHWQ